MDSAQTPPPAAAIQFHVQLMRPRARPWRRVLVEPDATWEDLHRALNAAMGWSNSHLHVFRDAEGRELAGTFARGDPVRRFFAEPGAEAVYEYDLGEGWEHVVTYEGPADSVPGGGLPACVAGEGLAPPEHGARRRRGRSAFDPADVVFFG